MVGPVRLQGELRPDVLFSCRRNMRSQFVLNFLLSFRPVGLLVFVRPSRRAARHTFDLCIDKRNAKRCKSIFFPSRSAYHLLISLI